MNAKVMKIEAGPDTDRETLERYASDELQALVRARPGMMDDPGFRDVLARARRYEPHAGNFTRSAMGMFKFDWLRA